MHEPARVCVGGLSHMTAPVELREHVALCREEAVETATALRREPGVNEALGLSIRIGAGAEEPSPAALAELMMRRLSPLQDAR
jgi:hypothetical protein